MSPADCEAPPAAAVAEWLAELPDAASLASLRSSSFWCTDLTLGTGVLAAAWLDGVLVSDLLTPAAAAAAGFGVEARVLTLPTRPERMCDLGGCGCGVEVRAERGQNQTF